MLGSLCCVIVVVMKGVEKNEGSVYLCISLRTFNVLAHSLCYSHAFGLIIVLGIEPDPST